MTEHAEPSAASSSSRLLLATDGSEHANAALRAGLRLVDPGPGSLLVTVVPTLDPSIVVGSGHAGPVMTFTDEQQLIEERDRDARRAVDGDLPSVRRRRAPPCGASAIAARRRVRASALHMLE